MLQTNANHVTVGRTNGGCMAHVHAFITTWGSVALASFFFFFAFDQAPPHCCCVRVCQFSDAPQVQQSSHLNGIPFVFFLFFRLHSPYFPRKAPFLIFVLCLSPVQRRPRPAPSGSISTPHRFRGWWQRQSWVKAEKLAFLGCRNLDAPTYSLLCPPIFSVTLLCASKWCFHSLQFWWPFLFFWWYFSQSRATCSMCFKKTATFHSTFADLRSVHAYLTPVFPRFCFFLVKVHHI